MPRTLTLTVRDDQIELTLPKDFDYENAAQTTRVARMVEHAKAINADAPLTGRVKVS